MRVVSQVVQLTEVLGRGEALGVTELAAVMDVDKSSIHRILRTLLDAQWVEQNPATRKYSLGPALHEISERTNFRIDLLEASEPVLGALAARYDETVLVSVRRGLRNVVEAVRESTQEARVASEPGRRVPLHCGAAGKTLMAFDNTNVVERVIADGLTAYTDNTITDPDRLRAELTSTRERGWGIEDQEFSYGVTGLGVPVWGQHGALLGAIALRAPSQRLGPERAAALAPALVAAADDITRALKARMTR